MSHYKPYPAYKDSGVEWLGQVPDEWKIEPLFTLAEERNESNEGMLEDNLLSLSYGSIVRKDINANDGLLPQSFETYQIIRAGDIVFRLTDLQNDQRSLRTAIVQEVGIITSAYTVVIPTRIRPQFFNYLLRAYDVQKVFYSMGGGMRQSMKFEDLRRIPILIPSMSEQIIIATHLDRETARIDALVAKKTRFIELLREKRQALITHAVTKGLDPNVTMKGSGVEWLGEVPEHWEVSPLKWIASIGNGSTPNRDNFDYWLDGNYPWLNSSVVNQDEVKESEQFVTEVALKECHLPRVSPPAILVGITGQGRTRGMAATLLFEATISQHVAYIKPNVERVGAEYLRLFFEMAYNHLRDESGGGGSTKGAITCEQLGDLVAPLPTIAEQVEISKLLKLHGRRIGDLIAKTESSIALLKERRSALITAAVTGQIDLRGAV